MPKAAFTFELVGVKEMMKLLEQLPTIAMQKGVLRNALKKAGKPIAEVAAINAPEPVKKTIKVSTSLKGSQKKGRIKDRSRVEVFIGSSHPLSHLFCWGTVERFRESGGATGHITAKPFLRPAWDSGKHQALKDFALEIKNQLLKAVKRLVKKAERGTLGKAQRRGLLR